ncbi:solute carrier family 22 member 15-like [Dysidea avara]|uniref:solute carrier family 22 member 15-like n=1 Tax=Dysidea avara TaxID=196820 RepID=UPI0033312EF8
MRLNAVKEFDVDDVLVEVGQWGRYQKKLFLYFNCQHVLLGIILLSIIFIGVEPSWKCGMEPVTVKDTGSPQSRSLLDTNDNDKCVMYEKQSCAVEVDQPRDQPFTNIVAEWDLYCSQFYKVALSQSLTFFGMLLGSWFLSPLADKIGRRKVYIYTSVLYFGAALLSAVSLSYIQFAFFRFLTGFAMGGCYCCYFVILMEIVGPDFRAMVGIINSCFASIVYPILPILSYLIPSWRIMTGMVAVLGFLHLTVFHIVPESPRWLLLKGYEEEALQILRTLAMYNGTKVPPEVKLKKEEESTTSSSVLDLFSFSTICTRTSVMMACWFSASISYYGLSLGANNLSDNLYVSCALMGLVELPGLLVCILAVDRYGRKMSLVSSLLLTGIACICSGAVQWISQYNPLIGTTMVLSLTGKFGVSTAFAVLYIYASELFPTEVRNKGLGVTSVAARVGGILAPFVTLLNYWSLGLPLIVMGLVPLISGLMSLLLPETKGKSLPDTLHELRHTSHL